LGNRREPTSLLPWLESFIVKHNNITKNQNNTKHELSLLILIFLGVLSHPNESSTVHPPSTGLIATYFETLSPPEQTTLPDNESGPRFRPRQCPRSRYSQRSPTPQRWRIIRLSCFPKAPFPYAFVLGGVPGRLRRRCLLKCARQFAVRSLKPLETTSTGSAKTAMASQLYLRVNNQERLACRMGLIPIHFVMAMASIRADMPSLVPFSFAGLSCEIFVAHRHPYLIVISCSQDTRPIFQIEAEGVSLKPVHFVLVSTPFSSTITIPTLA
jgi:hypothetical protein